jgi:hypothetical protein
VGEGPRRGGNGERSLGSRASSVPRPVAMCPAISCWSWCSLFGLGPAGHRPHVGAHVVQLGVNLVQALHDVWDPIYARSP